MSLLGLDVGTTGTKAVAFDLNGNVLASSYREYPLLSPKPGWQELDPNLVWSAVRKVLGEVAAKTKKDPVKTMAISAQGEACHAIDKEGHCLTNSVVTFDARTADYPTWWLQRKSRLDIALITGMPLHGMHTINKIMWFKQHQLDIYLKAWKFLCYEDFIHYRLGLEPVMSDSLAARTMAFDVQKGAWSDEMLRIVEINSALLPGTAPGGTLVGEIPDRIADELGLPRGVFVATGGHDQPAGALGAGILESGEAMLALGTVVAICPVFDKFTVTQGLVDSNLCCYNSCVPGLFSSLVFNFTGGSLLKWYRDTFAGLEKKEAEKTGRDVYDIICEKVPNDPGNVLVLPHFTVTGTPYFDTASRGVIAGLTLHTPREEIVGAILSGVTYEMKLNLELLKNNGIAIDRMRMVGGGAKNAAVVQRNADILGMPIAVLKNAEAAALGVAMLGGMAAGIASDLKRMAQQMVSIDHVYEPNPKRHAAFEERFAIYRDLYDAMQNINHRLTAL
jgi:xylulokinase